MSSKKYSYAFTLAELMVCLAIIAIISTMLIPTLANYRPNKSKIMFKKAYNITERVVDELVNDADLYPTSYDKSGFDNVDAVEYNGETYEGNTKFCKLFADKININEDAPNCSSGASFTNPSFTTNDGVYWVIRITDFGSNDSANYDNNTNPVITIDVNGDKNPNCTDGTSGCKDPDRFQIYVRADGKVKVVTEYAMKYIEDVNMISKN